LPGLPAAPELKDRGPVLNRVSHVVLYQTSSKGPVSSTLTSLVKDSPVAGHGGPAASSPAGMPSPGGSPGPGGPAAMPGGPGGAQGGAAASRDNWKPLGSLEADSTNHTTAGPRPPLMQPGPETTTKAPDGMTRTDFVILFVWKEPTTLDSLLGTAEAAPPGAGPGSIGKPPGVGPIGGPGKR
jgi:hypothetical protein